MKMGLYIYGMALSKSFLKPWRLVVTCGWCCQTSTIKTKFRTFPLEVIEGDPDLEVEMREEGAKFRFNFAEVRGFNLWFCR